MYTSSKAKVWLKFGIDLEIHVLSFRLMDLESSECCHNLTEKFPQLLTHCWSLKEQTKAPSNGCEKIVVQSFSFFVHMPTYTIVANGKLVLHCKNSLNNHQDLICKLLYDSDFKSDTWNRWDKRPRKCRLNDLFWPCTVPAFEACFFFVPPYMGFRVKR